MGLSLRDLTQCSVAFSRVGARRRSERDGHGSERIVEFAVEPDVKHRLLNIGAIASFEQTPVAANGPVTTELS